MPDGKPRAIRGVDLLNGLSMDDKGNLYWQNQRVKVEQPLKLTIWQKISAFLLVTAACVQAISAAWDAFIK